MEGKIPGLLGYQRPGEWVDKAVPSPLLRL